MPVYEFKCRACEKTFSEILTIVEHEEEALFALSEVALYRCRAEELRLEAHLTNWLDVRERLLNLAEQYEILADSLELNEGFQRRHSAVGLR